MKIQRKQSEVVQSLTRRLAPGARHRPLTDLATVAWPASAMPLHRSNLPAASHARPASSTNAMQGHRSQSYA